MSALFEKVLTTDRWPNRAVSPIPFDANVEGLPVVLVHPGWGKRPEMHAPLLQELTEAGFRAIGLDTRYGYADQGLGTTARVTERMKTGTTNPFFLQSDYEQNRYFYRRPTGLLRACVDLEIDPFGFVAHSEGVRIGVVAAQAEASPMRPKRMILVNGVGTGRAGGAKGMIEANAQAIRARAESEASIREALLSFRDSAVHFITHPRRTSREAAVISNYNAWPDIGRLALELDKVVVINSRDDRLISFEDAARRSAEYPEVDFFAVNGSHSSIYEPEVRSIIIAELTK